MIGFMPVIYPDELIYSCFCRYYVYSGYPNNKMALEDILYNRHCNPNKEFLGHLNPEMEKLIKNMYPIDKLILEHTMFPQYARFIECSKKKDALYRLGHDFCDAHQLFSILPRSEDDKYLKHCPVCALEDRELYGETYWHRVHQIRNMDLCVKHNCKLKNSKVTATSSQTFTLNPAEMVIKDEEAEYVENSIKLKYAAYMEQIFEAPMDFENETAISTIIYYEMERTKYISSTRNTRNTQMLADDMQKYFSEMELRDIVSMYQVQRTLLGNRSDFSVVCQIAFFLGMPVDSLIHPLLSAEQILREQTIRCSKEEIPKNWKQYDLDMAPKLEKVAYNIYHGHINDTGRPERVSERLIYKFAGLPGHRLENMPKCQQILQKYEESYAQNWARRLIWAYEKVKAEKENTPVYWCDIRDISGVKKKNADVILPLLVQYTDIKTAEEIRSLIDPAGSM